MVLRNIIKTTLDTRLYGEFEENILFQIKEYFIGAMLRHADPESTVRQFKEQKLQEFNKDWFDANVRNGGRLRQRSNSIFIETFRGKRYDSLIKVATGYSAKYGHRLHFSKDIFKRAVSAQCAMQVARYGEIYKFELYAFAMEILIDYFKIYDLGPNGNLWLFDADSLRESLNTILDFDDVNWDAYMEFLEMKGVMEEARRQAAWKPIKKLKPKNREDILQMVDYSLTKKENLERIKEAFGYNSINYVYKKLDDFNIDKDTLQPITSVSYEQQIAALRANMEYVLSAKRKSDEEIERLKKIIKEKDEVSERLMKILKSNNISI